ncbi:MAG: hypothetical protein JWO22_2656 [Frankiales bacterium]|nr:hypothetical protein [Frankiales bacterium]
MRRLLLLVPAVACFVTAVFLYPADAAGSPGSGFFGYDLQAQSAAIRFTEDEPSANSHPEAEGDVPQSQVSLAGGVGYALSSVAWPGSLVGNAGSLVLLVQPGAPSQVTALNDPVRAEARSGSASHTATNDSVPGSHMAADATLARTTADAQVDGGAAGSTLGFGSSSSGSVAQLGSSTAKVTADSTARDVSVAGIVKIGSVVSHAEATTDGVNATAKGKTTVSGLTVAGVPVVVDDQGVTVDTQHGAVPPTAVATVNSALASLGMSITLSSATQQKSGGTITYDAGSLLVFWRTPGYPSTLTASFGGSHVVAGASASSPLVLPPLPPGLTPVVTVPTSAPQPASPGVLAPVQPGGTAGGVVVPVVPGPTTAPVGDGTTVALEPVASGSTAPTWSVLLAVVGGLLGLAGLWQVPGLLLVEPRPVRCPLEEDLDD